MLTSRHDVLWESPCNRSVRIFSLAVGAGEGFIPIIEIKTLIGSQNLEKEAMQG